METRGIHRALPIFIQAMEYTPGVSTVSSIVRLALSALEQLRNKCLDAASQASHTYKIVLRTDFVRLFVLLLPVLGNVAIALHDYVRHKKNEKGRVLSQQPEEELERFRNQIVSEKNTKSAVKNFIAKIKEEDPKYLNTPWFMLKVTAFCPQILRESSLKEDKIFVLEACKENSLVLQYVGDSLKIDLSFWAQVLAQEKSTRNFPEELFANKQFILQSCPYFLLQDYDKIDNTLWKDPEFCVHMFGKNFETVTTFDKDLWKNKDFVLDLLSKDPLEIEQISEDLWKDSDFCVEAIRRSAEVSSKIQENISPQQAANPEFWNRFLELTDQGVDPGRILPLLEKIPESLRENEDFMVYAAQQVPGAETLAGPTLQKNPSFQNSVQDLEKFRR